MRVLVDWPCCGAPATSTSAPTTCSASCRRPWSRCLWRLGRRRLGLARSELGSGRDVGWGAAGAASAARLPVRQRAGGAADRSRRRCSRRRSCAGVATDRRSWSSWAAAGGLSVSGAETIRAPALPRAVVDTTGAGDSFDAGFLCGLLAGWEASSLPRARMCLWLAVRLSAGLDGQPTLDEALRVCA